MPRRKEPVAIRSDPRSDHSDSKTSLPETVEVKKEVVVVIAPKRLAEQPLENVIEQKKPCLMELPVLEDNLSEISDDADEILNRDEVSRTRIFSHHRFVMSIINYFWNRKFLNQQVKTFRHLELKLQQYQQQ